MTREEKLFFMTEALAEAKKAYAAGEVPIGAVVVRNGEIISRGFNEREKKQSATAHAEIVAIDGACAALNSWRLDDCELFVTVEPCVMCAGAAINARIKKVYFGAEEIKDGGVKNAFSVFDKPTLNWQVEWEGGVLADECAALMVEFFREKRKKLKEKL